MPPQVIKSASIDWPLWFYWIMATTLGWVLGRYLLPDLSIVTIGIALGIMQSMVLKNHIDNPWQWILATTAGWIFGSAIVVGMLPTELELFTGPIMGGTTGISQWILMRNKVEWSGWWIVFSIVGWTTGLTLLPGLFLTGTMAGLFTGTAMILLMRYPKKREDQ